MSASRRLFAVACHVTVVVWLAAYLAWSGRQAPAPLELARAETPARVEPRPEAPPESAPSHAEPETPAASEPELPEAPSETRVARADLAAGSALLDGTGDFPALSCSYEDFRSFREYAGAMVDLGARFVVVRHQRIVGAIDLDTGRVEEGGIDAHFSPRARDYTGEPGLANLARAARARFGADAVVMMLVPRQLDAGLFGGIARALSERGERADAFREIRGRYQRSAAGGVRLRVDAGVRPDGSRIAVDLLFDLEQIARVGAAESRV